MDILEEVRTILTRYEYQLSTNGNNGFEFEDSTLLGFVVNAPSEEILARWQDYQAAFLERNARRLRNSALKSWNLYSVFLASDQPPTNSRKKWLDIEEDLRATRKIAQANLLSTRDVERALYPFIPIQNIVSLRTLNLRVKLRNRLSSLPKDAIEALLTGDDDEIALSQFERAHENS
jgi:hypothetical protein